MNIAVLALILALVWAAITGNFSLLNLILGGLVGLSGLWLVRRDLSRPGLLRKVRRAIALALLFLYELLLSAFRVAWLVISPNLKQKLKPGIIAFPLTAKSDMEITLLANLITLTPGTLSVDVSDDRSVLYVHALAVPDKEALIADIARGFERKVIEVFE